MTNTKAPITYLTLRQFAKKHTFLSYGSLRQLVHHNKAFDKACIRRLGTRVLVNEEKAMQYIDTLSNK